MPTGGCALSTASDVGLDNFTLMRSLSESYWGDVAARRGPGEPLAGSDRDLSDAPLGRGEMSLIMTFPQPSSQLCLDLQTEARKRSLQPGSQSVQRSCFLKATTECWSAELRIKGGIGSKTYCLKKNTCAELLEGCKTESILSRKK